jgi:hypothetical protein
MDSIEKEIYSIGNTLRDNNKIKSFLKNTNGAKKY